MKTLLRFAAVLSLALAGSFAWSTHAVAQMDAETEAYANVVVCTDPDCADLTNTSGMEGATITSLDATGAEIDSCAVETFPSGMDGCVITKHAGDGSYMVSNLQAGYTLLSEEPEVLESESHGTQLVWYAAPSADEVPPPGDETDPVDELPEVGTGTGIGAQTDLLAVAALGVGLLGLGATAVRHSRT